MSESVEEGYQTVLKRVKSTCLKHGIQRPVQILAVSKKQPVEKILKIYNQGHRAFGESYIQEALEKIRLLDKKDIIWHFIGPLQSNKTKYVAEYFDWVQSVDSMKLLKRLNEQRGSELVKLNVLLQLKVGDEESKRGLDEDELLHLAESYENFPNLLIRGLMCIPPPATNDIQQQKQFNECYQVFEKLKMVLPVDTLSMGMSGDLESAIICGTTMVRIGTDIFGKRD